MARRASLGLIALIAAGGCAYAPSFSVGPPYGGDLVEEHHDAFPAASEREARFTEIRALDSQQKCEERLAGIGEVVRLSAYEALAHHATTHAGRPVVEEHHCARETLRVRAWYSDGQGASESHH